MTDETHDEGTFPHCDPWTEGYHASTYDEAGKGENPYPPGSTPALAWLDGWRYAEESHE